MSTSSIVLLIVAIVLLVIIAYLIGIIIRKKNDGKIAELEERQRQLLAVPLAEEVTAIKNLQLVGQSQENFLTWEQKWSNLSSDTFTAIEDGLEDLQNYNDTFNFMKVKKGMVTLDSQLTSAQEELSTISEGLSTLREQEEKNSARVKYALDLYEELQDGISAKAGDFGPALAEINKQLSNIQAEFTHFVALNSSGDPVEAAEVLEKAEEHTIALGQIGEAVPGLVAQLEETLPDQLDDLETGYAKLLESNYHFGDNPIESRFQTIRESLNDAKQALAELELDKVEAINADTQERLDALYGLFEQEINAHKAVKRDIKRIPAYLEHVQNNNTALEQELERLSRHYILDDSEGVVVASIARQLEKVETTVLPTITEEQLPEQPYSELEKTYQKTLASLKRAEDDQQEVLERLKTIETDESRARTQLDVDINRLHIIKRFMEKRHLPGIPQEFLSLFFTTSSQLEALMTELNRGRIDVAMVNKLATSTNQSMVNLEETAYRIIQEATLTEQLLQYSNRYRSFEPSVQASFEAAYQLFEINHDYQAAFEEISYALELVEPGVTERFVKSYERTRETIRF